MISGDTVQYITVTPTTFRLLDQPVCQLGDRLWGWLSVPSPAQGTRIRGSSVSGGRRGGPVFTVTLGIRDTVL